MYDTLWKYLHDVWASQLFGTSKSCCFAWERKRRVMCLWNGLYSKLERRVILFSIVIVKDFPRVQKMCVVFLFFKFISNNTQNSFLLPLTKTYFDIRLRPTPTNWRVMLVQIKLYHACFASSFLYLLFGIVIIIWSDNWHLDIYKRNLRRNWNDKFY